MLPAAVSFSSGVCKYINYTSIPCSSEYIVHEMSSDCSIYKQCLLSDSFCEATCVLFCSRRVTISSAQRIFSRHPAMDVLLISIIEW